VLQIASLVFFFSSRRRHTRFKCDWSSDVCSSDLSLESACLQFEGNLDRKQADSKDTEKIAVDFDATPPGLLPQVAEPPVPPQKEIGRASCRGRAELRAAEEGEWKNNR